MKHSFKFKKNLVICFLSLCVLISCVFLVAPNFSQKNTKAAEISVVFNDVIVEDSYLYNSSFVLPKQADVKVDDNVYPAIKVVLKNPNGVLSYEDVQVLDTVGNYTLQIFYNANNSINCYEKTLVVYDSLFNVSSSSSNAEFGDFAVDYKATKDGLNIQKGIKLKLTESDTFTYRKPIKLNDDGITEFLTFSYPYDGSAKLSGQFNVKLIDIYDASKYVEFRVLANNGFLYNGESYYNYLDLYAGFNGVISANTTTTVGIRKGTSTSRMNIKYNGEDYFVQSAAGALYEKNLVTLSFNASDNSCYFQYSNAENPTIISDLDIIEIYDGQRFDGFTNNEVYVSITPTSLQSNYLLLDVLDICGENTKNNDGTNIVSYGFDTPNYFDEQAPVLTVDYTPSYQNYVYAAKDCKFPVFEAQATDENLSRITTEVYYNYGKADEFFVSHDGEAFLPTFVGNYTIVYKAYDTFGNVSEVNVPVICVETPSNKLISSAFDTTSFQKEYFAGYSIKVPSFEELSVSGINGEVTCSTKVVCMGNGLEYAPDENGYVVLNDVGDWKIVYTLIDNVTSVDFVIDIQALSSDKAIIDKEPVYPKYFIKGLEYDLESVELVSFLGSKIQVTPDVFYKYKGETEFKSIDGLQKIEDKEAIQFQYKYNGKIVYTSKEIDIINVGYDESELKIDKYFIGDFVIEPAKSNIVFTSNKTSGNNGFEFIKHISLSNFSLSFLNYDNPETTDVNESTQNSNYERIKITLTDYYDSNNSVEIKLTESKGKAIFSVGEKENSIPTEDFLSIIERKIRYEKGFFYFGGESIEYNVPFTSDKCYVKVELCGITGESKICIRGINNQQFRTLKKDTTKPQLYVALDLKTYCVGDTFKVSVPTASDVLSLVSVKDVKLTVTSPDDNIVIDSLTNQELNDVVADNEYSFKFDTLGRYTITFEFKDQNNMSEERTYSVYALDKNAPTVTFKDGSDVGSGVKYKLGEQITIKDIVYYDDVDESLNVVIMVTDPNFNLIPVTDNVFTPLEKGKFRISYRVSDISNNSTVIYYYVVVE